VAGPPPVPLMGPVEFAKYHATPKVTAIAATTAPMIAPFLSIASIQKATVAGYQRFCELRRR